MLALKNANNLFVNCINFDWHLCMI